MIIRKLNKTQECTCTANLMKLGIGKSSPVILPPNPCSSPHCFFVIFVIFFSFFRNSLRLCTLLTLGRFSNCTTSLPLSSLCFSFLDGFEHMKLPSSTLLSPVPRTCLRIICPAPFFLPMSLPPQQYPSETTNQNQDIGCLFFK